MIATDEDALICDMAETYHIYDMESFDPVYIAILAVGLRQDSRIKKKLSGIDIDVSTLLLARIVDNTAISIWQQTRDGHKGRNRPKSVLDILTKSEKDKPEQFESGEDFMSEWRRICQQK